MVIEIKVPSVGESIQEAVLVEWFKHDGDVVEKDEPLFVIETDKVTLEVVAEESGRLEILAQEGETVKIGGVVARIDTDAAQPASPKAASQPDRSPVVQSSETASSSKPAVEANKQDRFPSSAPPIPSSTLEELAPSVRRLVVQHNIDVATLKGTGPAGRITKGDVLLHLEQQNSPNHLSSTSPPLIKEASPTQAPYADEAPFRRKPMSPMRRKIAERLLQAKQNTAMLTTFNEIDMSRLKTLRAQYKDQFENKYKVRLGFMSFFIKAGVTALKEFPQINTSLDGQDILYHHHYHIGVAVGTERGLVVPVIFDADRQSFADLESAIVEYVKKIKENRLTLAELEGGTFTITNGGVYGSLLSTPILNIPQSAILGMHKIEDRPIAINGQVVIRPMMYVALSYDHRLIDGREAVSFLARIKALIENPERMMMEI